jgi:hypothetical protein
MAGVASTVEAMRTYILTTSSRRDSMDRMTYPISSRAVEVVTYPRVGVILERLIHPRLSMDVISLKTGA